MRPNSIVLGSVCDDDEGGRGATRAKSGTMPIADGNGPRDSGPSRGDDVAGGRGVTRAVDERACYFRVC
jgi:hypothetical protein